MPLNLDIIGTKMKPLSFCYDADKVILYAMGIGAGVDDLEFVYEKNLKVYPTFAVIPFMPALLSSFIPFAGLNLKAVLHGEHTLILHQPIPVAATVHTITTCEAIYDKGDKGAVVHVRFETYDEKETLLFENRALIMDRSAGNFGGKRGPSTPSVPTPDASEPDFIFTRKTSLDQAALYRLSGDKNPLHIDPDFAAKAGFERPILHGLCSFGFAGRAVLENLCDNDPARLKSLSVRFMNVVYPGDTLTTRGWKIDSGCYVLQTTDQNERTILGNAFAEVIPAST